MVSILITILLPTSLIPFRAFRCLAPKSLRRFSTAILRGLNSAKPKRISSLPSFVEASGTKAYLVSKAASPAATWSKYASSFISVLTNSVSIFFLLAFCASCCHLFASATLPETISVAFIDYISNMHPVTRPE